MMDEQTKQQRRIQKLIDGLPEMRGKKLRKNGLRIREWHATVVLHLMDHDPAESAELAVRTLTRLLEVRAAVGPRKGRTEDSEAVVAATLAEIVKDMDATWNRVHDALDAAVHDGPVH